MQLQLLLIKGARVYRKRRNTTFGEEIAELVVVNYWHVNHSPRKFWPPKHDEMAVWRQFSQTPSVVTSPCGVVQFRCLCTFRWMCSPRWMMRRENLAPCPRCGVSVHGPRRSDLPKHVAIRQHRGPSRGNGDDRIVPVDIVQPKIGDIAGTQGEPGEEQHDGAIPQSHGRRQVARCDDVFDIVARQMTGQCREPLLGNRRNRTDKPRPTKAVQREEAQIQPKR